MNYTPIIALTACFVTGAASIAFYYESEISDMKAAYALAAEKYQTELTQKERENAEKLAQAVNARQAEVDKLNGALDAMRTDVERLRLASARSSRMSAASGDSCGVCQRQVRECVKLLGESAELFEEGGGLLRDFNADREAVRKLK